MSNQKTPIAVFVYNRPDHAHSLFTSLANCSGLDGCQVHVFCDGPTQPKHEEAVAATRKTVKQWVPRLQAMVTYRTKNLGLARSIVSGVSQLCDDYSRVIVLEDDLVLHQNFLNFMTDSLAKYENNSEVFQISGFSFPLEGPSTTDTYFLPLATTWGWATWRRAWQHFRWDPPNAVQTLTDPVHRHRFDLDGTYPYSTMLADALRLKVDSWGVRWQYAVFQAGAVVLYPWKSLVWNAGFDNSGVHCQSEPANWQGTLSNFQQRKHPPTGMRSAVLAQADEELFSRVKSLISRSQLGRNASSWSRVASGLGRIFGKGCIGRP